MAAKDRIGKASEAVRSSDYLKRLIEDEQLRDNLLAAYAAGRSAYGRVSNGKPAGKALLEDRKLQKELSEAAARAARRFVCDQAAGVQAETQRRPRARACC